MLARIRRHLAQRALAKLIAANRAKFSTQDYAKRRASALKATRA